MRLFLKLARCAARGERGQSLVLFAGLALLLFAAVGLSVDVGQVVLTRTTLQKASDAAALAGAQELPHDDSAKSAARDYAAKNSPSNTEWEVSLGTKYYEDDSITVTTRKRVDYTFLRALGLRGTTVSATATARRGTMNGAFRVVPWGLVANNDPTSTLLKNPCYVGKDATGQYAFKQNQTCTLKYGAGTSSGGDFGALSVDAPGADPYRSAIGSGATSIVRIGDRLNSETGNMVGPTAQGVGDRLASDTPSMCPGDSRSDVLTLNGDSTVSVRRGCENSPRLVVIPIVDQIKNPELSTVLGFAVMYLHDQTGSGGHSQITGEFITIVSSNPNFVYNGTSSKGTSAVLLEK